MTFTILTQIKIEKILKRNMTKAEIKTAETLCSHGWTDLELIAETVDHSK